MHKIGATCEIYHSNVVNEDEEVEEVEVEEMKVSEDREKEVKMKNEDVMEIESGLIEGEVRCVQTDLNNLFIKD